MSNAPEFITKLKAHIKSTNKEGILDCSGQDGIVDEICPYSSTKAYGAGDTDVVIKWNECGIISFTCKYVPTEYLFEPNELPSEITDLDLNNGHITGTCTSNTTVYAIAIAVIVAVLVLLVILGLAIFCCCCRKKSGHTQVP